MVHCDMSFSQDELRHGWGVQVWTDGARYEGEWSMDKAHGHGKFVHGELALHSLISVHSRW